jgi:hypothetical protein
LGRRARAHVTWVRWLHGWSTSLSPLRCLDPTPE